VLAEAGTKGTQSQGGVTALLPLPQTPAQSETQVPATTTTSNTGESVFAVVDWLSAQLLKTSLVAAAEKEKSCSLRQSTPAASTEDRAQEQGQEQGQGQGQEPFSLAEYLPRGMLSTRYLLEASYQYAGSASSSSVSVAAGADTTSSSSSDRGVVSPAVVVLGKIAPEGDNVADGMQLAGATLAALGLFSVHSAGISSANTNTGSSDSVTAPAPVALALMYPMSWQFKFGGGMGEMTRSMLF
jgi:hypothetical protein